MAHFPAHWQLLSAAILTGAIAAVLRIWWPVGVNVWGLQLAYFASYVVLFVAGCAMAQQQWLERIPDSHLRPWLVISLISLPVLPAMYFLSKKTGWPGGHTLELAYAFWEPLVAWGIILFLLRGFLQHLHQPGRIWRALSRRAYTIFVIHPPVLVGVALIWRHTDMNALLKTLVTGSISCALCFIVAGWLLQVPLLKRIL